VVFYAAFYRETIPARDAFRRMLFTNKNVDGATLWIYHCFMDKRGVALVEIIVSMIVLAVTALAVTATVAMVNSKQMRSAGGSSLDLQALSYARETLESLKNSVSTETGAAETGAPLVDSSYAAPCTAALGSPCGAGTLHAAEGLPLTGLPPLSDLATKIDVTNPSTRTYTVWDISSGTSTLGTDVAYKKVTVTVLWTDPV